MKDLFSIQGKVALVTGGSRGIGAMIARGFESAGCLTCNAVPPGAGAFWDAMGFARVTADGWTHEKSK